MTEPIPATLDSASYLRYLEEGDAEPRKAFLRSFRRRLPPIAHRLAVVHRELARLGVYSEHDERLAHVHMFLHAALNSVFCSTMLLVEGYPLASGALMRHYAEATAMALLLVDDNQEVWRLFDSARTEYPVHKSIHRLLQVETSKRLRRLLGFDAEGWKRSLEITRFYDNFSHSSAFALGYHVMFDRPGVVILGPQFDPGKRMPASIELKRRKSALRPLAQTVRAIRRVARTRAA